MLNKNIFVFTFVFLFTFSGVGHAIFDSRLPVEYEYLLMRECVKNSGPQASRIKICACALRKTIEDRWPDYDAEIYLENSRGFARKFAKNIIYFSENREECK